MPGHYVVPEPGVRKANFLRLTVRFTPRRLQHGNNGLHRDCRPDVVPEFIQLTATRQGAVQPSRQRRQLSFCDEGSVEQCGTFHLPWQHADRSVAFALREEGLIVLPRRVFRDVGRFRRNLAGMARPPGAECLTPFEQGDIAAHLVHQPDRGIVLCAAQSATYCSPEKLPADLPDGDTAPVCHLTELSH